MANQTADITWRDGRVPVSARYDDPYFSLDDGLSEARHVFLAGNGLPGRFRDGLRIAELGFGTGLNFLAAVQAWSDAGVAGRLSFTSFEAFPMTRREAQRALAAFPAVAAPARALLSVWDGLRDGPVELERGITLHVIIGDARHTLPQWGGIADAWFLDGFSPARNPELWGAELIAHVGRHTAPGGTAATYTAAGFVRKGLAEAGFIVERRPGFGRKRHMTAARMEAPG